MIAFARLHLPYEVPPLFKEAQALPAQWMAHFNQAHYSGEWTAIPLRSPNGEANQILPGQGPETSYANTPLLDECPAIRSFLSTFQCPLMSVRLMKLARGAVIKPHRDQDLAFERGEVRLHFPLQTNEEVAFYAGEVLLTMRIGECWYVNVNLDHSVYNRGETDRIHLVVDCLVNDWIKSLFDTAPIIHSKVDEEERARTVATISELRLQGTAVCLALADSLEAQLRAQSE